MTSQATLPLNIREGHPCQLFRLFPSGTSTQERRHCPRESASTRDA